MDPIHHSSLSIVLNRSYSGSRCDASQTAKTPISMSISPRGVHRVIKSGEPRDMYTLSTWAPVNPAFGMTQSRSGQGGIDGLEK